jgi:small conductance mechanosensitive channel
VAGIGVAGLGLGIALQGVLSNVVAGLSIILTKPLPKLVGEIPHNYGTVRQLDLTVAVGYASDLGAVLAAARGCWRIRAC